MNLATAGDEFFQAHFDRLFAYVRMRVGEGDCEDLVGDILLRAIQRLDQVTGDPVAWLFAVARSQIADHYRRAYRTGARGEGRGKMLNQEPEVLEVHPATRIKAPLDELEAAEFNTLLRSKFTVLSEQERDVIALKFTDGLANTQIAELLGVTPANLGVILHRALKRLRAAMQDQN